MAKLLGNKKNNKIAMFVSQVLENSEEHLSRSAVRNPTKSPGSVSLSWQEGAAGPVQPRNLGLLSAESGA